MAQLHVSRAQVKPHIPIQNIMDIPPQLAVASRPLLATVCVCWIPSRQPWRGLGHSYVPVLIVYPRLLVARVPDDATPRTSGKHRGVQIEAEPCEGCV